MDTHFTDAVADRSRVASIAGLKALHTRNDPALAVGIF
jgi:hypothetical protein